MTRAMIARRVLAVATAVCALGAALALLGIADAGADAGRASALLSAARHPARTSATRPARIVVERGTVTHVVDAVSFDVRLESGQWARVRALGVQPPGACYADASVQFARRVLEGKAVALVSDAALPPTDQYDRRLAYTVVGRGDYAVLAAAAGVARPYGAGTTPERTAPVHAAQEQARLAGRGLWGPPCAGSPAP